MRLHGVIFSGAVFEAMQESHVYRPTDEREGECISRCESDREGNMVVGIF